MPLHDCSNTRLCLYTIVPLHNCMQTQLCPNRTVPEHDCAQTQLCPYTTVPIHFCGPLHNCAQTQLCPYLTVPLHNCMQTQLYPNTTVPHQHCAWHMLISSCSGFSQSLSTVYTWKEHKREHFHHTTRPSLLVWCSALWPSTNPFTSLGSWNCQTTEITWGGITALFNQTSRCSENLLSSGEMISN